MYNWSPCNCLFCFVCRLSVKHMVNRATHSLTHSLSVWVCVKHLVTCITHHIPSFPLYFQLKKKNLGFSSDETAPKKLSTNPDSTVSKRSNVFNIFSCPVIYPQSISLVWQVRHKNMCIRVYDFWIICMKTKPCMILCCGINYWLWIYFFEFFKIMFYLSKLHI